MAFFSNDTGARASEYDHQYNIYCNVNVFMRTLHKHVYYHKLALYKHTTFHLETTFVCVFLAVMKVTVLP